MKGKSYISENRDLAFRLYCECGGNVEAALRALGKAGLKLSKPTFYEWMTKFNFEARRLEVDKAKAEAGDVKLNFRERAIADLLTRKKNYDLYFGSLGPIGIDNQATYAYSSLVKTIAELQKALEEKVDVKTATPVVMGAFVDHLNKTEPDAEAKSLIFQHVERFMSEVTA